MKLNKITKFSDNVIISILGHIAAFSGDPERTDVGDNIDRGLILIRELKENGFLLVKE